MARTKGLKMAAVKIPRNKLLRSQIRDLYLKGVDVDGICEILHITKPVFYYHKNQEYKKGSNWDTIALRKARDEDEIKVREAVFLKTLIASFDKFIETQPEMSDETLNKLEKYAQTYWRLKAPTKADEFAVAGKIEQAAKDTIKAIGELALELENSVVCKFLSENADEILSRALLIKKGKKA